MRGDQVPGSSAEAGTPTAAHAEQRAWFGLGRGVQEARLVNARLATAVAATSQFNAERPSLSGISL
jgi:hypothetical protein